MIDDKTLERRLDDQTAPRVTRELLEGRIVGRSFVHHGLLTICILDLVNGFMVTGESACASADNYDAEIGEQIAFDNAFAKMWALEGYVLKTRLHEAGKAQA